MKKHKMEFAALTLLLGVLCYAFYDCNIEGSEQEIVLTNELFSVREIKSKEDITMEMLTLPGDKLLEEQEEVSVDENIVSQDNNSQDNNSQDSSVLSYEESEEYEYSITLTAYDTSIPYNEIISNQVVNYALGFVGGPYVYGGNSLTNGTDCSGFTKLIYEIYGVYLPRTALDQSYSGVSVGLSNIMPGDLVFSGYDGMVGHVAIYIGNNKLVHALNSNVGIVVTDLYIMPILDVRRVI